MSDQFVHTYSIIPSYPIVSVTLYEVQKDNSERED